MINYDQMGNPTNYISKNLGEYDTAGVLEYDGRQLVRMTNGSDGYDVYRLKEYLSTPENRLRSVGMTRIPLRETALFNKVDVLAEHNHNYENGLMTKKQEYDSVDVDGEGNLVFSNPNHTYTYYWDNTTLIGYTIEGNEEYYIIKVVYGEDGEPAGFTVTDGEEGQYLYFYTKNLQGDITGICNKYGNMCLTFDYDAYGLPSYALTGNPIDAIIAVTFNPFLYRGYMYDINTGLYYLQSRFYNPIYGRFLNADETDILQATQGEMFGANLFAYCENNPINRIDMTGQSSISVLIDALERASGLFINILNLIINTYRKELKQITSTILLLTRKQTKQAKLFKDVISQTKKMAKYLGGIAFGITLISFIITFTSSYKSSKNFWIAAAYVVAELFIYFLVKAFSWISGKIGK